MKSLLCLSLDYTAASTAERDGAKRAWLSLPALREDGRILEAVPVATCNRTEIYLRLPPGGTVPEEILHHRARTLSGEEAVLHLLRVLLGLESMACGESSIVGQVRESYGGTLRAPAHGGKAPGSPFLPFRFLPRGGSRGDGGGNGPGPCRARRPGVGDKPFR